MSLFDTVQCDYPLPDPEFQHEEFQTKDLARALDRYRITADGRLLRLPRRVAQFAQDTRPPDATEPAEDVNYHGDLCFYTSTAQGWIEYHARFTHGYLDWILHPGEAKPVSVDSLERLARDARNLERERATKLEALLQRLEVLDPEVAKQAVFVFDNRADAALWLVSVHPALGQRSPCEELARGNRQAVLDTLVRLLHGIPG